ncbi:hypothetical protein DFH28DRAFT_880901 [Melampsora americana]|nr:hypothetical protein DFH28DRAFT_906866 [Melampsora americana]KAH9810366.1 hypothetical protein DFH28DRAFT_902863 [Melampsora americana]KAH9810860.1 hypothetical protein DFH28DRAFT_901795 [Melampsora americana]KAH9823148.1 hypothetical protein DFH28DRAFT_880901 [Melampsora americana]
MMTRTESTFNYVPYPSTADPRILQGMDQCFQCGAFGHCYKECAFWLPPRYMPIYPPSEPSDNWRRMPNGKFYSLKALLGQYPYGR